MDWKVELTQIALDCLKTIRDSNPTVFARIKKAIDRLVLEPVSIGKKLTDPLSDYWRLRVGDYRIIYLIKNETVTVTIIYAGHRKEVYTKLKRFLKG